MHCAADVAAQDAQQHLAPPGHVLVDQPLDARLEVQLAGEMAGSQVLLNRAMGESVDAWLTGDQQASVLIEVGQQVVGSDLAQQWSEGNQDQALGNVGLCLTPFL